MQAFLDDADNADRQKWIQEKIEQLKQTVQEIDLPKVFDDIFG